ncbi:MAG: hypothetical protein F6K58_17090 [Symploca sp. SIO2E9]|nr:hypothetical protein [Symploca sp. SIO2E9]
MANEPKYIKTVEKLHQYLIKGMKIEHATIPPYLTALYSLKPGSNLEGFHMIRAIVVEEMLHLTLAANVFNAVGGEIGGVLIDSEFIPSYPTKLPTGADDFCVNVDKFSPETVETFLNIERSKEENAAQPRESKSEEELLFLQQIEYLLPIFGSKTQKAEGYDEADDEVFYSIGEFYQEIINGLIYLYGKCGDDLFSGALENQISREYYYNGAGEIVKVTDIESAIKALKIIQFQGEGSRHGDIYDDEKKLCHYYRFQQLELGRYYVVDEDNPENSDKPDHPTGDSFTVDWDAVYPVKKNAKLSDYPVDSELYTRAQEFQKAYSRFLKQIEISFNGKPETLVPAVGDMFRLRDLANSLIRNPIPENEDGCHGAPIYREQ